MSLFGGKEQATGGTGHRLQFDQAVKLKATKGGYEAVSFGTENLAQDTVVDGASMDAPQWLTLSARFSMRNESRPRCGDVGLGGTR